MWLSSVSVSHSSVSVMVVSASYIFSVGFGVLLVGVDLIFSASRMLFFGVDFCGGSISLSHHFDVMIFEMDIGFLWMGALWHWRLHTGRSERGLCRLRRAFLGSNPLCGGRFRRVNILT